MGQSMEATAAQMIAEATRLEWSVDAVYLYDHLYGLPADASQTDALTRNAATLGCRVETLLTVRAWKRVNNSLLRLDG